MSRLGQPVCKVMVLRTENCECLCVAHARVFEAKRFVKIYKQINIPGTWYAKQVFTTVINTSSVNHMVGRVRMAKEEVRTPFHLSSYHLSSYHLSVEDRTKARVGEVGSLHRVDVTRIPGIS